MREISAQTGGLSGQSHFKQLIGFGTATKMDSIIVEWTSGYRQVLTNKATDSCMVITEPSGSVICGEAYIDANNNCIKDSGEQLLTNSKIVIEPNSIVVYTDQTGSFSVNVPEGNYTIRPMGSDNWTSMCSSNNVTVVGIGNTYCTSSFGYRNACGTPDLKVELVPTPYRIGAKNLLAVQYQNNGGAVADSVNIDLTFDSNIFPISSTVAWTTIGNNMRRITIPQVGIKESNTIYIIDSIPGNVAVDTPIDVSAAIQSKSGSDCNNTDNTISLRQLAVGSFDPNDILVSPEGYISAKQELTYTIRFQNYGNVAANRVEVRSELPSGLDINTFKRGMASHAYTFEVEDGNILVWSFPNINLPPSDEDELGSQGFVMFKITPKQDLAKGSIIDNKASIIFDNNDPIITNVVRNIVGRADIANAEPLILFPNPTASSTNIRLQGANNGTIAIVTVCDVQGKVVEMYNNLNTEEFNIPLNGLPDGVYFIYAQSTNGKIFNGKCVLMK